MKKLLFTFGMMCALTFYGENDGMDENVVDETVEFIESVQKKYGVSLAGIDASPHDPEQKTEQYAFIFKTDAFPDKSKARLVVLNILKDCVAFINSHEEGMNRHAQWPFPADRITVSFCENVKAKASARRQIIASGGKLKYVTQNPNTAKNKIDEIVDSESLEDACAIADIQIKPIH